MRLFLSVLALSLGMSYAFADPRDRDYRSGEVREIQERLIELNFVERNNFEVDGVYGEATRDVVRRFQRDRNISPADGEAGPLTVEALFSQNEQQQSGSNPQPDVRCKREEIAATGEARPIESWAMALAKKNWRAEVRARFGEEWTDLQSAKVDLAKCFEASVGGLPLKRCRVVATPCNPAS